MKLDSHAPLKTLSDADLDKNILSILKQERELLSLVLEHLREIERRRLFSALGYQSLFDYAIRRLGYSDDQAYRRIAAMRLVREIPEIQEKIERGTISLSHVGIAQRLFKNESSMSREEKIELFEKLENTSKREAEKITLAMSSLPFQPVEIIRQVSPANIELRFTAKEELLEKIDTLKGLLAHRYPNISLENLFDILCEAGLDKYCPTRQRVRRSKDEAQTRPQANEQSHPPLSTDSSLKSDDAFVPAPARDAQQHLLH